MNPVNVLKIDSSARINGSVTRQLTERLVGRITDATVVTRDVAGGLPIVSEAWVGSNFTPKESRSPEQTAALDLSNQLIAEIRAADVLVIGAPMYNFTIPAALKTWIDLISRVGETFQYTETGPVGLLEGKRVIVAISSGGVPVGSPIDFTTTYLTHMLNFIGITDITFVSATGMAGEGTAAAEAAVDAIDVSALRAA